MIRGLWSIGDPPRARIISEGGEGQHRSHQIPQDWRAESKGTRRSFCVQPKDAQISGERKDFDKL